MKYLFLLLVLVSLNSCDKDDVEMENFRVNHYKNVGMGIAPDLVFLVQEGNKIGTSDWQNHHSEIIGFNYEWGYVYDLKIKKTTIENPPQDGSSIKYELEKIISKTPVDPNVTFNLTLKSTSRGMEDLLANNELGFILLNQQQIDCADLCDQLTNAIENQNEITGVFSHTDLEIIELKELLFE